MQKALFERIEKLQLRVYEFEIDAANRGKINKK